MSLMIEKKLDGGYVVTHHDTRQVVAAQHVANLIIKYWPDVLAHIRAHIVNEWLQNSGSSDITKP